MGLPIEKPYDCSDPNMWWPEKLYNKFERWRYSKDFAPDPWNFDGKDEVKGYLDQNAQHDPIRFYWAELESEDGGFAVLIYIYYCQSGTIEIRLNSAGLDWVWHKILWDTPFEPLISFEETTESSSPPYTKTVERWECIFYPGDYYANTLGFMPKLKRFGRQTDSENAGKYEPINYGEKTETFNLANYNGKSSLLVKVQHDVVVQQT